MSDYTFEKADKDLFAVYQTVYSEADIEMWYDWNARLNDTKWSDDCYFLCRDGQKIGGAICAQNLVIYAFIIPPFCDRRLFWKKILEFAAKISTKNEIELKGVLSEDVDILLSFGARIWRPRQIMCRPTDKLEYTLQEGFTLTVPAIYDILEIAVVIKKSFTGTIAYEVFGEDAIEDITRGVHEAFERYETTKTIDLMAVVKEKSAHKIVGVCIAGVNPKMPNLFAGIDNVCVLPEYRRNGLAEAMIKYSITAACPKTPAYKLHVLIGNPAENLYRKLGFIAGPRFTDMKYIK